MQYYKRQISEILYLVKSGIDRVYLSFHHIHEACEAPPF